MTTAEIFKFFQIKTVNKLYRLSKKWVHGQWYTSVNILRCIYTEYSVREWSPLMDSRDGLPRVRAKMFVSPSIYPSSMDLAKNDLVSASFSA